MPTYDQDGNPQWDSSTLEGQVGSSLGSIQGANVDKVLGFLNGAGAPEGFDWSSAVNATNEQQRNQFGGWSTFDDPGQIADKFLSNVDQPWASTYRTAMRGDPSFQQSQAQGASDWNASQVDDSTLGIDNSAWLAMSLLAGGAGLAGGAFAGAGGASAASEAEAAGTASSVGSGAGAWSTLAPTAASEAEAAGVASSGGSGGSVWDSLLNGLKLPTSASSMVKGGSPLSSIFNIGTGLYGIKQASDTKKLASQIMSQSDPLAGDRAGYASQLKSLIADPSGIVNAPEYKAGEQAIMRRMASQGYIGSGNMMKGLQDFGGNLYDQQVARLQSLATNGAGAGSATGATLTNSSNAALISALNRIGYGASGGF